MLRETVYGEVLSEVVLRLTTTIENKHAVNKEVLTSIHTIAARISDEPPTPEQYAAFLKEVHDLFTMVESPMRAMLLRIFRLCTSSKSHCAALVDEEVHWIVVVCLERDQEFLTERMQAIKLVKKFVSLSAENFPIAFARSLVAIANHKEDNLRRISLELLRDLSTENCRIVAVVNGISTLMEAVLEPSTSDMAEPILLSILYLLNDPKTRRFIRPYLDLRTLLAPFTDLDSDLWELSNRWKTARAAFVTVMRSWAGIVQLTSDDLGLTTLVRLLRDRKVSADVQDAVLDAIAEVFEPVTSKVRKVRGNLQSADSSSRVGVTTNPANVSSQNHRQRSLSSSAATLNDPDSELSERRRNSGANLPVSLLSSVGMSTPPSGSSAASVSLGEAAQDPDAALQATIDALSTDSSRSVHFSCVNPVARQPPSSGPLAMPLATNANSTSHGSRRSSTPTSAGSTVAPISSQPNRSVTPVSLISSTTTSAILNKTAPVPTTRSSGFNFASIFGLSSPSFGHHRRSASTAQQLPQQNQSGANDNAKNNNLISSDEFANADEDNTSDSSSSPRGGKDSKKVATGGMISSLLHGSRPQTNASKKTKILIPTAKTYEKMSSTDSGTSSALTRRPSLKISVPLLRKISDDPDPLFNILDNYAALLCCAFIHAEIVESLCSLSVQGVFSVATKARRMLVSFLLLVAKIFPDNSCAQLLTLPSLLEFSAIAAPDIKPSHSHKASQVLIALADAFSMAPHEPLSASGVENRIFNVVQGTAMVSQAQSLAQVHSTLQPSARGLRTGSVGGNTVSTSLGPAMAGPTGAPSSIAPSQAPIGVSKSYGSVPQSGATRGALTGTTGGMSSDGQSGYVGNGAMVKSVRGLTEELRVFIRTRSPPSKPPQPVQQPPPSSRPISGRFSSPVGLSLLSATSKSDTSRSDTVGSNSTAGRGSGDIQQQGGSQGNALLPRDYRFRGQCSISKSEYMQQLRAMLAPSNDRSEFNRQMDLSRVLGKDKDPLRWDWVVIADMLENGFQSSDRLSEAIQKRWIKRLMGYFHCSSEDASSKSQVIALEWDPTNLLLLECGCNLFHILTEDEQGMGQLRAERNSLLFVEMSKELENLVAACTSNGSNAPRVGATGISLSHKNTFRLSNCSLSMARELFTLLGRVAVSPSGRSLLDTTSIATAMANLGSHRQLDYLSRLIVTSVGFTDGGYYTKQLMQHWGAPAALGSVELRLYIHNLMRALFRARPREFYRWGIEVIVKHVVNCADERSARSIVRVLDEVCQDQMFLRAILSRNPPINLKNIAHVSGVLTRFLAAPEGVELLEQWQWLEPALDRLLPRGGLVNSTRPRTLSNSSIESNVSHRQARCDVANASMRSVGSFSSDILTASNGLHAPAPVGVGLLEYVEHVDQIMTKALSRSYLRKAHAETCSSIPGLGLSPHVAFAQQSSTLPPPSLIPIVIPVRDLSLGLPPMTSPFSSLSVLSTTTPSYNASFFTAVQASAAAGPPAVNLSTSNLNGNATVPISAVNSPTAAAAALASSVVSLQPSLGTECNQPESIDLEGLLRIPWNIEVKLSTVSVAAGSQSFSSSNSGAGYGSHGSAHHNVSLEYLKVDSYLDATELGTPATEDIVSNVNRLVRIRGVVLDARGMPTGHPIASNRVVSNCLMAGSCAVHRDGRVISPNPTDLRSATPRKRTATISGPSRLQQEASAQAGQRGRNVSLPLVPENLEDIPPTYQYEHFHDWSSCKPGHRQGKVIELGDAKFAVEIAGEPVVWIFSRVAPGSHILNTNAGGGKFMTNSIWQNATTTTAAQTAAGVKPRTTTPTAGQSVTMSAPDAFQANSAMRSDASRAGGFVYLLEVHYMIRLQTGQGMFASIPRHIYGELARNENGMFRLEQRCVIPQLLLVAKDEKNIVKVRRAALWSLGHIGASEFGYTAIHEQDPGFLEYCVRNVLKNPNYSLRGTFFHAVGLLGRTTRGSRQLTKMQWDTAPSGGNSAVAIPRNVSLLFACPFLTPSSTTSSSASAAVTSGPIPLPPSLSPKPSASNMMRRLPSLGPGSFGVSASVLASVGSVGSMGPTATAAVTTNLTVGGASAAIGNNNTTEDGVLLSEEYDHSIIALPVPPMTLPLTPYMDSQTMSVELEVLNLIAKLPGVIVYRDCRIRLDQLRNQHPDVFGNRRLYVTVHKMFEGYSFKLNARRDILKLFLPSAACKYAGAAMAQTVIPSMSISLTSPPKGFSPPATPRVASF